MKSIQTKIITLIVIGIVVSTLVVGGTGIYTLETAVSDGSAKTMNLLCTDNAAEINSSLERIEQSVGVLAKYTQDNWDTDAFLERKGAYVKEYTEKVAKLGNTIAVETDGMVAIYLRFNSDLIGSESGFLLKNAGDDKGLMRANEKTFESFIERDVDGDGCCWYHEIVELGEASWLNPYQSDEGARNEISYTVPVYKEGVLIGAVGIDINLSLVTKNIDRISLYKTGYAFLTDENFEVLHSKNPKIDGVVDIDLESDDNEKTEETDLYQLGEFKVGEEVYKVALRKLNNNTYLAVTVPYLEIVQNINDLVIQTIVISTVIIFSFVCASVLMARNIIKPLKELNEAAKEIADGNLDVDLKCNSDDEVGTLTESFRETAQQLKIRIDYINNLAYEDKLTGVKNSTAYLDAVTSINNGLKALKGNLGIFLIDVNGLKNINDKYGHDRGNELIKAGAGIMVSTFGYEHVYRIGGDEFIILLDEATDELCQEKIKEFKAREDEQEGEVNVVMAIGYSIYDPHAEEAYKDVFQKADEAMYVDKQEMKKQNKNSSVRV